MNNTIPKYVVKMVENICKYNSMAYKEVNKFIKWLGERGYYYKDGFVINEYGCNVLEIADLEVVGEYSELEGLFFKDEFENTKDCGEFKMEIGRQIDEGDILTIEEGIIIHQVNAQGVMGSGFAKNIKEKYPQHYEDYIEICDKYPNFEDRMGKIVTTKIKDNLYIFGVFGQLEYGRDLNICYTNYESLEKGLREAKRCLDIIEEKIGKELRVFVPSNIGSGLANGEKNIIHSMLYRIFTRMIGNDVFSPLVVVDKHVKDLKIKI